MNKKQYNYRMAILLDEKEAAHSIIKTLRKSKEEPEVLKTTKTYYNKIGRDIRALRAEFEQTRTTEKRAHEKI